MRHVSWLVLTIALIPASAQGQEPAPLTPFASIGRHAPSNPVHFAMDRVHDKLDRCLCCSYGKTHNDIGVQSFRGTKTIIFGSACEFFTVPCRTPPPQGHGLFKWWRGGHSADCGCR